LSRLIDMRPAFLRKINLVSLIAGSTLLWGLVETIALQVARLRRSVARHH